MNKELEALRKKILKNCRCDIKCLEYDNLLKALTPPTQEEVCEAIKNYMHPNTRYCVNYNQSEKAFKGTFGVIVSLGSHLGTPHIIYETALPPYLNIIIGRFYEGIESK